MPNRPMSIWRGSTGDIGLQGGRLDLRDRSLSTQDVDALSNLLSSNAHVSALILYNVRLNSDVRKPEQRGPGCCQKDYPPSRGFSVQEKILRSLRGYASFVAAILRQRP